MTDKDKLAKVRAEIERRYKYNKEHENDWAGTSHYWQRKENEEILSFIDSMQEESVSEDLEEAVNAYIGYAPEVDESSSTYGKRQAFKIGANWQKEQMMNVDAIETPVCAMLDGIHIDILPKQLKGYRFGDKVKVIIIKED